jgi:hypothetical protein
MTLLEAAGFDDQNTPADIVAVVQTPNNPWQWNLAEGISTLGPGRFGGKAVYLTFGGFLGGTLNTPLSSAIIGFAVYIPSSSGSFNGGMTMGFYDSTTQTVPIGLGSLGYNDVQFIIRFTNTGHIVIIAGPSPTVPGGMILYDSGPNVFPVNTWMYVEMQPTVDSSAGGATININGANVVTQNALNTEAGLVSHFDSIVFGEEYPNNGARIDDVYISDLNAGPGANPFNAFQGPVRVFTRFPNGAGSAADWTPLSGANYTQVQEHSMDGDTTYNYDLTSTVGDKDLFAADPLPPNSTPLACKVKAAIRQDASGGRAVETLVKSGGTTAAGTSVSCFQSYAYQADVYPLDPNGDIPWTKPSVDASEIGYELTA